MILRNPQLLWLLVPLLLLTAIVAWPGVTRRAGILLRCLLLAVLVLALADPVRPGTAAPPALLVLVDASASVPDEQKAVAWQQAQAVAASHGQRQTTLAAFGRNVVVATDPAQGPPAVDETGSDVAGALRLAAGMLRSGGRVLLISDGATTTGGVEQVTAELAGAGIAVDVLPIATDEQPDVRIAEIAIPDGLREGQSFRGEIVIAANTATRAILQFQQDDEPASEQTVNLRPGRNRIDFAGTAGRSGVHRYSATLPAEDAHPENNNLARAIVVGPAPRVLVVEREPDSGARLRDLLEEGGVQSEARRPADLPSRLSELQRFDAVVLQDVPANALSLDQQSTLHEYVRSLGHGLLALGGSNSYGLGDYKGTPLEDVLPVAMQPPPRRERQAVAILLIVDRSASMYGVDPQTSKLELAKGAAIAATQALVPNDRLGVLVFDTETRWTIPFTTVGEERSLAEIQTDIARIRFGGGTDIFKALDEGLPELAAEGADGGLAAKHAVLLTDGRSFADQSSYDRVIAAARQQGVTLSTIAIGEDADTVLLERLAASGAGRYHFASDPQDLPRLTLKETEIAREDPKVEGELQPRPYIENGSEAHATLRGFVPSQIPNIGGYVATTIKPDADLILESPEGDAVLAGWQYGLGRALAWTSDSGERWAGTWQRWDQSAAFWTQVLGYTFPDPTTGPLQTRIEADAAGAMVIAEATDASGAPLDLADVAVRIEAPAGAETTLPLKQVAPGRYEARVPAASALPGAYRLATVLEKGEQRLEALAGWSQPYAAEFAGGEANTGLLQRVAQATGGATLSSLEAASAALQAPPAREPLPLWPWLAGAALALWVVEVAIRRGWLLRPRGG